MNANKKKKPIALELLDDLFDDGPKLDQDDAVELPSIEIEAESNSSVQQGAAPFPQAEVPPPSVDQVAPHEETIPPFSPTTKTMDAGHPTMTQRLETSPTMEQSTFSSQLGTQAPHRLNVKTAGVADVKLAQSENLRFAQEKILDLESEVERLRRENEALAAAGETLRRRADELLSKSESLEHRLRDSHSDHAEEKQILMDSLSERNKAVEGLQLKIDELEMRLNVNIKKIRVRERELENRLELVKMESSAVVRSKDEIILDLKRQVDQLAHELENYRDKGQELNKRLADRQEVLRRTVRALRIALTMLEGSEDETLKKKAE